MQQVIEVTQGEGPDKKKVKKSVVSFCVINFNRQEEMVQFETEFNKAVEALKAEQAPAK